jgi:hypothetical protein
MSFEKKIARIGVQPQFPSSRSQKPSGLLKKSNEASAGQIVPLREHQEGTYARASG